MRIIENEIDGIARARQIVDQTSKDGLDRRDRARFDQRQRADGDRRIGAMQGGGEIFEEAREVIVLRIEEELGTQAYYAGRSILR